jgi:hypothetical protein
MVGIPLYCTGCSTIRSVEDWRETPRQTMLITMGPCGHEQERTARLEWRQPPSAEAARARCRGRVVPVPARRRGGELLRRSHAPTPVARAGRENVAR